MPQSALERLTARAKASPGGTALERLTAQAKGEPTLGERAQAFASDVARGVGYGAVSGMEALQRFGELVGSTFAPQDAQGLPSGQDAITQRGQELRAGLEEATPIPASVEAEGPGVLRAIGQGIGSTVGAAAQMTLSPTMGAASVVGGQMNDTFNDAKAHGADDADAFTAAIFSAPGAALDIIPGTAVARLRKIGRAGKALADLNKRSGGLVAEFFKAAAIEGGTEGAQGLWENIDAKWLVGYDKDREALEGVGMDTLVGTVVGVGAKGVEVAAEHLATRATQEAPGSTQPAQAPEGAPTGLDAGASPVGAPVPATAVQAQPSEIEPQPSGIDSGETAAPALPEQLQSPAEPVAATEPTEGPLGPQEAQAVPAAEPTEPNPEATGIKNRTVDAELEAMGLPPAIHGESRSDAEVYGAAKDAFEADPQAGRRLVDALAGAQRPATDNETALLTFEVNRLINERDIAREDFAADPSEENQARLDRATADYARAADVVTQTGTESGRAFRLRRMMIARDYSRAAMESARAAALGRPLSNEESAQVKDLHDKLAAAEKALAEQEAKHEAELTAKEAENAFLRLQKDAKAPAKTRARKAANAESRAKIDDLFKQLVARAGTARTGLDTETLSIVTQLAAEHIKIGVRNVAEFTDALVAKVGEHMRPYVEAAWKAGQELHAATLGEPIAERLKAGDSLTELSRYVHQIAEEFVRQGVRDVDSLIDAVHGVLQKADPNITRRQTMDAISNYGTLKRLNMEDVKVTLRDLKGQMQQLAKLEDLNNKLPPKKTGVERRDPSDAERRLIKQVNELKKKLGITTTDPATQLRSALDAIKTRLSNQIKDLQHQIDTGTRIVKGESVSPSDAEVESLRKQRDELKAQFAAIFPKLPLTDEQRIEIATKAVTASIARIEEQIRTGDIAAKKAPLGPTSPALEALRARRKALGKELAQLREAAKPPKPLDAAGEEQRRTAAAIKARDTRLANEVARWQQRITFKDFGPSTKKAARPMSPRTVALAADVAAMKRQFARENAQHAHENRATRQKIIDAVKEALALPKAVKTAWDASAVLRQGAFFSLGHPVATARMLAPMFRATFSDREALERDVEIRKRPLAVFGEASKLFLSRHGDDVGAHEEAIRSALSDKIPGIKASNRAFITFLNMQRAFMFDAMVQAIPGTPTLEQGRAIANAVNIATGRGNTGQKFAGAVAWLSHVLWSPRLLLSRFQLLAAQPIWKGDAHTRKLIAKEYARSLIGLAGLYAMAKLATSWMDDEDKPTIEIDPRSADFGKLRFGDTRIDPLAGLSQVTVLLARLIDGNTKSADGKITPIRGDEVPYKGDTAWELITRFLRSKLSPTISTPVDIASGEDINGQPVTPTSAAKGLLVPLAFSDIKDAMQEHGVAGGAALGILSIFGMSLQNYGRGEESALSLWNANKAKLEIAKWRRKSKRELNRTDRMYLSLEAMSNAADKRILELQKKKAPADEIDAVRREFNEKVDMLRKEQR